MFVFPYLNISIYNKNMDKIEENIKSLKIEEIKIKDTDYISNFIDSKNCSRCGGEHFDLSCIYSKN